MVTVETLRCFSMDQRNRNSLLVDQVLHKGGARVREGILEEREGQHVDQAVQKKNRDRMGDIN